MKSTNASNQPILPPKLIPQDMEIYSSKSKVLTPNKAVYLDSKDGFGVVT